MVSGRCTMGIQLGTSTVPHNWPNDTQRTLCEKQGLLLTEYKLVKVSLGNCLTKLRMGH